MQPRDAALTAGWEGGLRDQSRAEASGDSQPLPSSRGGPRPLPSSRWAPTRRARTRRPAASEGRGVVRGQAPLEGASSPS